MKVSFEVEQAGCESCGKLLGAALSPVGTVESIDINEGSDTATVVLSGPSSRGDVNAALEAASGEAGHAYSVRAGSWRSVG